MTTKHASIPDLNFDWGMESPRIVLRPLLQLNEDQFFQ
jgi:hypothetical protein